MVWNADCTPGRAAHTMGEGVSPHAVCGRGSAWVPGNRPLGSDPHVNSMLRCAVSPCAVLCCAVLQGMWNELLGFGDFYYELGVQLLEACLASRCDSCCV
jgi:hypothetical protein